MLIPGSNINIQNDINRQNYNISNPINIATNSNPEFINDISPDKQGQSNINSLQVNSALKAQTLSKSPGYKEIKRFNIPYYDKQARLYKLDNGQQIVIMPLPLPFEIKTYVKVGSFNEPDFYKSSPGSKIKSIRGISHDIEHNMFKGSRNLAPGEFVKKVTEMGGEYNASTATNQTNYYVLSPIQNDENIENLIRMHAEMISTPQFSDKTFNKEKNVVISEIHMFEDSPSDKIYYQSIKNLFNIKADYQDLTAGADTNIRDLTPADAHKYYKTWYAPDNRFTVVVGDVDPDKTIRLLSKNFNTWDPRPKNFDEFSSKLNKYKQKLDPIQKTVRTDLKSPNVDSVDLNMAFAGPKSADIKDSFATAALCYALSGYEGSRLRNALKPFNTVAGIAPTIISPDSNDPQMLSLNASFTPGQEEEGLKTIYQTLFSMQQNPVDENELRIIKNKMKDEFNMIHENPSELVDFVSDSLFNHGNLKVYTDRLAMIDSLSAADIQNAAKYLDLNKTSIVMMHPDANKLAATTSQPSNQSSPETPKPEISGQIPVQTATTATQPKFKGSLPSKVNNANVKFTTLDNITEYDLANNMRLAVNNSNCIRSSGVMDLKTDTMYKSKPGAREVLSLMMNKGTQIHNEDEFNKINDSNNLGIFALVGGDSVNVSTNCPNENLPMALELMKEVLLKPDLSEKNFEKSKQEIKLNLTSMQRNPKDRALEIMYPDSPYGYTARKIREEIDKLTLQDVKELYSNITQTAQGKAIITAPLTKNPALLNTIFSSLQRDIPMLQKFHYLNDFKHVPVAKPLVLAQTEDINQADITQIYKIPVSQNIKDQAALNLLNEILGGNGNGQSRLYLDLRETQNMSPYVVKSFYENDGKAGELVLHVKADTKNVQNGQIVPKYENLKTTLDGFKRHIDALKTSPVTQEELNAAKMILKSNVILGASTSIGQTSLIHAGYNTTYGVKETKEYLDAIDKITPDDIQKSAVSNLSAPSIIAFNASSDTIQNTQDYLKTLGEVKVY